MTLPVWRSLPAVNSLRSGLPTLLSCSYAYLVTFRPTAPMVGQPVSATGLDKNDNTVCMKRVMYTSANGPASLNNKSEWANHILSETDLLIFSCTAVGVANIRKRRGVQHITEGCFIFETFFVVVDHFFCFCPAPPSFHVMADPLPPCVSEVFFQ